MLQTGGWLGGLYKQFFTFNKILTILKIKIKIKKSYPDLRNID